MMSEFFGVALHAVIVIFVALVLFVVGFLL